MKISQTVLLGNLMTLADSLSPNYLRQAEQYIRRLQEDWRKSEHKMQYPPPVGHHPFEEALRHGAIKRYIKSGLLQSSEIFITICNGIAVRRTSLTALQLDLFEHCYRASPERVSAAMIKAIGKRADPLSFCNNISVVGGVSTEQAERLIRKTGWEVIPVADEVPYVYTFEAKAEVLRKRR